MPLVSSWRSGYLAATRSSAAPFTVPSHIAPTAHLKPAQGECLRKVIARQGTIQSSPARKRLSGDFGISNCRQPKSSTGDLAARGRRGARFPKTTSFGPATPNPISNCGSRLRKTFVSGGPLRPVPESKTSCACSLLGWTRPRKAARSKENHHDDPADGERGIVVDDLDAVTAFLVEIGLELEGRTVVEGSWAARVAGLDDVKIDVAIVRTPDGQGPLEAMKFHTPAAVRAEPESVPANTLGIRRILFAVETSRASSPACEPTASNSRASSRRSRAAT